ncbi:hypothetical protein SteCoe_1875 [Stentor coeruleus]|uniref:Uncharacterized protein n=1 Tax=Stentor coeruleus TaxID=5963 RepID=A0A1R2D0T9_9CILI|nr:hypothetical protein SteCoe_1875 [Stentor coeruleus]
MSKYTDNRFMSKYQISIRKLSAEKAREIHKSIRTYSEKHGARNSSLNSTSIGFNIDKEILKVQKKCENFNNWLKKEKSKLFNELPDFSKIRIKTPKAAIESLSVTPNRKRIMRNGFVKTPRLKAVLDSPTLKRNALQFRSFYKF